jgi:ribosome-associated protein
LPEEDNRKKMEADRKSESPATVKEKAVLCVEEALRFKALDLVLLDLSTLSSFADYFIICSGRSSRQVQGIADNLESSLSEHGMKPLGIEGRQEGHWILMDYGEVIIHIFYEQTRSFYDLESLWSEAEKVRLEINAGSGD